MHANPYEYSTCHPRMGTAYTTKLGVQQYENSIWQPLMSTVPATPYEYSAYQPTMSKVPDTPLWVQYLRQLYEYTTYHPSSTSVLAAIH